jgi:hypothetical protein
MLVEVVEAHIILRITAAPAGKAEGVIRGHLPVYLVMVLQEVRIPAAAEAEDVMVALIHISVQQVVPV